MYLNFLHRDFIFYDDLTFDYKYNIYNMICYIHFLRDKIWMLNIAWRMLFLQH